MYGFAAETGYALHSELQSNPLTVTPLAGFGYTHLHADGFTESGANAADLAVSGSDVDSFTTSFGARASTRIDAGANGVLVPEAHAIWQREFLDDRAKVGAAFAVAPGSNFMVVSNRFGTNTGLVGIGITQEASADVKIFVNYDAQIQSSFASHTISAGLRVRFNSRVSPPSQPSPSRGAGFHIHLPTGGGGRESQRASGGWPLTR
ncbi:MAG TPA: autotransporter outer membrane beta-barrel domain-containing protein [Alphaproteobacteria bacterium]